MKLNKVNLGIILFTTGFITMPLTAFLLSNVWIILGGLILSIIGCLMFIVVFLGGD